MVSLGPQIHQFSKKPFWERAKDTGFLLKHTFTVVARDPDIKKPTIHMVILTTIIRLLILVSIVNILFLRDYLYGVLGLLVAFFVLMPFRFFYDTRQKADQSWIVYNTITGSDISYRDAHRHTASQKGKLRFIAAVDLLMAYIKTQTEGRTGLTHPLGMIAAAIVRMFFAFLLEFWDLLSHYMLPAVVVEQKPLREVLPDIKNLKSRVPETLVGVFGIDFVGEVVHRLIGGAYILVLLVSGGLTYLLSEMSGLPFRPSYWFIGSVPEHFIPLIAGVVLIVVVSGAIQKIVESVKVIYFTIFYTTITRPMDIREEMRAELTSFLQLREGGHAAHPEPVSQVDQPHPDEPKLSREEDYLLKLADYIKQYERFGHTDEEVRRFLESKGHRADHVQTAIELAHVDEAQNPED